MSNRKIGFIEAAMKYRNIVFSIAVLLLIFGAWALKEMPRNEFPEFTIRQGLVVGVYPGATSQEVEEQQRAERVQRHVDQVVACDVETAPRVVQREREAGQRPPGDGRIGRRQQDPVEIGEIPDIGVLHDGALIVEHEGAVEPVGVDGRHDEHERRRPP